MYLRQAKVAEEREQASGEGKVGLRRMFDEGFHLCLDVVFVQGASFDKTGKEAEETKAS